MSHLEDHLLSIQVLLWFVLLVLLLLLLLHLLDIYEEASVQDKLKEDMESAGSEETDLTVTCQHYCRCSYVDHISVKSVHVWQLTCFHTGAGYTQ